MTKAEAIDLVILPLSGGKLSNDNNIQRPEVEAFLDLALATAVKKALFEAKALARTEKASGMLFEDSIPETFFTTETITPTKNTTRGVYSAEISGVLTISQGWGIRNPRPVKNIKESYGRLPDPSIVSASPAVFEGQPFFWAEYNDNTGVTEIFFTKMPAPVCNFLVQVIKNPTSLDADDTINAPDDMIMDAIRAAIEHFAPQASTKADIRSDDKGTTETP